MKKLSIVLLVLVLGLIVLSGCSSNSPNNGGSDAASDSPNLDPGNTDKGSESDGESKASYYLDNPAEVTMFTVNHASWPHDSSLPVWNWIKDRTNITIKGSIPAGETLDAYNLMMASGDVTDIVFGSGAQAIKYGQAGAFIDFNEHIDQMPNLKKFWDENPNLKARGMDPTGSVYIAYTQGEAYSNGRTWMYREDIFNEHDLKAPTTWEELYEVSKELKTLYPDSFPFTFRSQLAQLDVIGSAFETNRGYFQDFETGEVIFGSIDDNFKEMLEWLHKFHDEGLIPPDWLSMDTKNWAEYMTTGQAFISLDYVGRIEYLNTTFSEAGESGRMKFMAPPAGPTNKQWILDGVYGGNGFAVYSEADLDAALAYIDFLYSEEAFDILSWGIEGESYEVVDGKRQYILEQFRDLPALRSKTNIFTNGAYGWVDSDAFLSFTSEKELEVYEEAHKYYAPQQILPPPFTSDEQETISTVNESITKHAEENIAKFILGNRPLTEWDKFVQEIKDLDVQQMVDLHRTAWDRQN